jgi:hypothetical protein
MVWNMNFSPSWTTLYTIIATALIVLGGGIAIRQHYWLRKAHLTQGTVIELIKDDNENNIPEVSFVAEDGSTHYFKGDNAPSDYSLGEKVPVAYKSQSYEGQIFSFQQCFGISAILIGVGLSIFAIMLAFKIGEHFFSSIYLR